MARSWYNHLAFLASVSICLAATQSKRGEMRENIKNLAKANNYLAFDILHQLPSNENVFFSPLSLSSAFGMLYLGSKGETAQELRNTLGYEKAGIPEKLVHRTFQKYLTALPSQDPSTYILTVANSILVNKHLNIESSYIKGVQNLYQASIKDFDFEKENQQVVKEVNDWVRKKTNGKIKELLDELNPDAVVLLLNAVYFKGIWETQFDPKNTMLETFYNKGLESEAKKVPMMKLTHLFSYASFDDFEAIEIPYKGDNISMVFLLPDRRDGLKSLEKSLTAEKLFKVRNEMYFTKVDLTLPKFKIEYSREMAGDFISLGANSIFSPGADFSGITSSSNVYVNKVHHKAVIEVNEEGSEEASAAAIAEGRSFSSENFFVDRPFLFATVDKKSDMILFLGHVTNLL